MCQPYELIREELPRRGAVDLLVAEGRGFSAVETTVILVAFVALASVFAFTVMSTGLLTSEQSAGAILSGLETTTGTLIVRGAVVGVSNEDHTALEAVRFQVVNPTRSSDGIDLSSSSTVVTYIDDAQVVNLSPDQWTATWLSGFGSLVNPGERVEISLDLTGLDPPLGLSKEFFIEVSPNTSISLIFRRVTPPELADFVDIS